MSQDHTPYQSLTNVIITLTTNWQEHTLVLVPNASDADARLVLGGLGLQTGNVWLANVSVQTGNLLLGRWATEPLMDRVRAMAPQVPPATLKGRLRSVVAVDQTALLGRIRVPTLALVGAQDRLVPRAAGEWMRRHLRRLDVVRLQGPHWLLQTRPDAAVQAIEAFLGRLSKSPAAETVDDLSASAGAAEG